MTTLFHMNFHHAALPKSNSLMLIGFGNNVHIAKKLLVDRSSGMK